MIAGQLLLRYSQRLIAEPARIETILIFRTDLVIDFLLPHEYLQASAVSTTRRAVSRALAAIRWAENVTLTVTPDHFQERIKHIKH